MFENECNRRDVSSSKIITALGEEKEIDNDVDLLVLLAYIGHRKQSVFAL